MSGTAETCAVGRGCRIQTLAMDTAGKKGLRIPRATAHYFLTSGCRANGISAAGFWFAVVGWIIPITHPFGDITCHVIQTKGANAAGVAVDAHRPDIGCD